MLVGWALLPVVYALILAAPTIRLPGDDLGIRRFRTPPVAPGLQLSQTFGMTADGLHAVDLVPAAVSGPSSGHVRFELYDVSAVGTEFRETRLRDAEVPVGQLRGVSSYRFEFAPISDSRNHTYRVTLSADAASGVAFWATRGERYAGGTLFANDAARWADLAFRTHAPVPSTWDYFARFVDASPVRASVVFTLMTGVWLLVGVVIRRLPMDGGGV
jgi:hypothetical protein